MHPLYLKPPLRRPVCVLPPLLPEDTQGAIPRAWCRKCGKEVFGPGKEICPACEKEEFYEMSEKQPL